MRSEYTRLCVAPCRAVGPKAVLVIMSAGWLGLFSSSAAAGPKPDVGKLRLDRPVGARFAFGGVVGDRVKANIDHWLLPAPEANPGMIEMFRLRDRKPVPKLVPWAGEFVGKFLISAIQARRMSDRPDLDAMIRDLIAELISTQADDGYLGPFRKEERLLKHWDLWGHYHCMLALLMWHEDTGSAEALTCATRAADLVCKTYLDTGRRVFDAGSHEMNMSIIHSLGWLYRQTSQERYFRMMQEILKDWERAGDYFRTGLQDIEFFRTPKPRWESLHCLQGMVEMFRITGSADFKTSYVNLWTSIARNDRHNTGGFSTGEQAVGNPYTPGAIETCCTTAWMALTVDALRLTGDSAAADELEWSTFNGMLGSQHPSGRWWTYNTPMDGAREASHDTIVFQARAGTPELNCCSVNAPRGLGMLSEWAVMTDEAGPIISFYGPCDVALKLRDGTDLRIQQQTAYPKDGNVKITLAATPTRKFAVRLRVPFWSKKTTARVNDKAVAGVEPGRYLSIERTWKQGDVIGVQLDMSLRTWCGDLDASGKASIYYGPLLLAFDQHFNEMDPEDLPALDLKKLDYARLDARGKFKPIVLFKFASANGKDLVLCDFATAGACGTTYRSWLPVVNPQPAPFRLRRPKDGSRVPEGPLLIEWAGSPVGGVGRSFELVLSTRPDLTDALVHEKNLVRPWTILRKPLKQKTTYYWKVISRNQHGTRDNEEGVVQFTVDPSLPNAFAEVASLYEWGPNEQITASALDGNANPDFGLLDRAENVKGAADRKGQADKALAFNGKNSKSMYKIAFFPSEQYTFYAWVQPQGLPTKHITQIFSAWCKGLDDPLRVTIEAETISARVEAARMFATPKVKIQNGKWIHVAAVKTGTKLSLYLNGERVGTADVPRLVMSGARDFALGANPHFTGDEYFAGCIDDFAFHGRALTADEIAKLYDESKP